MAGRPPKPQELLELTGAFKQHPERKRAAGPKPDESVGNPPGHLTALEKRVWREIRDDTAPGVLTKQDRSVLMVAAKLGARMRKYEDCPVAVMTAFMQALVRMGLTPSDRNRIAVTPKDEKKDDPLDFLDQPTRTSGASVRAGRNRGAH